MKSKISVGLTAPGQFGIETVRCVLNNKTVREIIVYSTQRQLNNLLQKSGLIEDQIIEIFKKINTNGYAQKSDFPEGYLGDPFFEEGGNLLETVGNIPLIFTTNANLLTDCKIVFIGQNMAGISAEYERHPGEKSTLKSLSPFINNESVLISLAKGISKEEIAINEQKTSFREGMKTGTQEIKGILPNNECIVMAGPSSAQSLAKSIYETKLNRFFFNIAHESSETRTQLIDILNNKMIGRKETSCVFGTELLGASKNVFAFINGILEGYGVSDEIISLYQTLVQIFLQKILIATKHDHKLVIESPAGLGDFLLTCKKGRNGEGGRLIGKKLKEIKELNLNKNQIKQIIKTTLNKYGKTVEGYHAASGLLGLLRTMGILGKDLILLKKLIKLLDGKTEFEKVYSFLLKRINYY